ncbi:phosphopantetheine-binding protein [Xanthomonas hortorum pv. pelargonii]|nr:phosphopantetheine-binding protein [Xanthomonas hortorum pv. pelargonii]
MEALFDPAQLSAMFEQYAALLRRLAGDPDAWDLTLDALVPPAQGHATARVATAPLALTTTTAPAAAQPPATDAALVDTLRAQFQRVTELPIAARQSFFEAGASSLQLVQLHLQLRQAGHDGLAVTDLFATCHAARAGAASGWIGRRCPRHRTLAGVRAANAAGTAQGACTASAGRGMIARHVPHWCYYLHQGMLTALVMQGVVGYYRHAGTGPCTAQLAVAGDAAWVGKFPVGALVRAECAVAARQPLPRQSGVVAARGWPRCWPASRCSHPP